MYEIESEKHPSLNELRVEIIIPTLNEETSIGKLLREINSLSLPIKLSTLVIDGGSTDKTVEICKKENVKVIKQHGKGKGTAMREAVDFSTADIVVFVDGDGTYPINKIESLLEPLLTDQAEMVIGSRLLGKREKGSISNINILGNKIFNNCINFALKANVTDSLSGYRAIYRKIFKELILFSNSFEIEVELTVETIARGYRLREVPIDYKKRHDSESKLNSAGDGTKIANTLFFVIMNVKPLLFFGIMSAVFFIASFYPLGIVLYEITVIGYVIHISYVIPTALLMITGVITFALGILSELIVRSRRRIEFLVTR